jgi:hypothetical protein
MIKRPETGLNSNWVPWESAGEKYPLARWITLSGVANAHGCQPFFKQNLHVAV